MRRVVAVIHEQHGIGMSEPMWHLHGQARRAVRVALSQACGYESSLETVLISRVGTRDSFFSLHACEELLQFLKVHRLDQVLVKSGLY